MAIAPARDAQPAAAALPFNGTAPLSRSSTPSLRTISPVGPARKAPRRRAARALRTSRPRCRRRFAARRKRSVAHHRRDLPLSSTASRIRNSSCGFTVIVKTSGSRESPTRRQYANEHHELRSRADRLLAPERCLAACRSKTTLHAVLPLIETCSGPRRMGTRHAQTPMSAARWCVRHILSARLAPRQLGRITASVASAAARRSRRPETSA